MFDRIQNQDPLKQGLKHYELYIMRHNVVIQNQDPLKQGLKPVDGVCYEL